ncbi:uncharacterized protein LOC126376809 [Pectinophora gossypiella]|uniref:uncharacterized protein LOC126376809 n=1 Tax=Pectinophora gossypiella TaxID=13191 RepID=UPI00214DF7DB|nr:uncharacterized protein LOC126376809 [Pectinophora gossypiella]
MVEEMKSSIAMDYSCVEWAWVVPVVPLLAGCVYAVVTHMCIRKKNWRVLFTPEPYWGPRDHVVRQLRKQFISPVFVGSSASRYLARYMLNRYNTATYRLDVNYFAQGRRSTVYALRDFGRKAE